MNRKSDDRMLISVEELQVSPVSSYPAIEAKIAEGTRNRTLAATNMNATSSRAHTIVAIHFNQKTLNEDGKSMTKQSVINLVDLAGRLITNFMQPLRLQRFFMRDARVFRLIIFAEFWGIG